jgi:hypothetical protein
MMDTQQVVGLCLGSLILCIVKRTTTTCDVLFVLETFMDRHL